MPSMVNKAGSGIAPESGKWYNLSLGSSFKDPSSSRFRALRYESKPASIDKCQHGSLHKSKENRVCIEIHNSQQGKSEVVLEGRREDNRENDALLVFDGETFRLERMKWAVKELRPVVKPGESSTSTVGVSTMPEIPCLPMQVEVERIEVNTLPMQVEVEEVEVDTHPMQIDVEWIDVGDLEEDDTGSEVECVTDNSDCPNSEASDMEEALADGRELTTMNSNSPNQCETEEEISDVDVDDDEPDDNGCSAAEALRAQINGEQGGDGSSESSGSFSNSRTYSGISDSESDDADSANPI